ncbi:hypothetical protein [Pelomonas sp. Root1237]|uniref:hypothetical protein n=1 Tax=Pelomonas sp. Root1237 TaxID=1736434 RepID=UPI0012FC9568|nr:hypothetical protein [Pelomonas sp. Root1237]
MTLAGFATFFLLAFAFYAAVQTPLAAFAKHWFICGAIVQYLCSLPMEKSAKALHDHMSAIGKPLPKSRDAILAAAKESPHLIPGFLLEKYNLWQSVSIFLGGALLCSIILMAISFLKFI